MQRICALSKEIIYYRKKKKRREDSTGQDTLHRAKTISCAKGTETPTKEAHASFFFFFFHHRTSHCFRLSLRLFPLHSFTLHSPTLCCCCCSCCRSCRCSSLTLTSTDQHSHSPLSLSLPSSCPLILPFNHTSRPLLSVLRRVLPVLVLFTLPD